jgi:general secretion pathway protein B
MSFILDALKKSENERQENVPAEYSSVPASQASDGAPRWLWVLGGLLLINVLLLGVMLTSKTRQVAMQPPAAITQPSRADSDAAAPAAFAARLEEARQQLPDRTAPATRTPADDRVAPEQVPTARVSPSAGAPVRRQETNVAFLPSLDELRANGTLQVPELHVDIHVFSDEPGERFVFINMNKYREQSRLSDGPLVREITRDGVVLDQDGTVFFLRRD